MNQKPTFKPPTENQKQAVKKSSWALPAFALLSILFMVLARLVRNNQTLDFDSSVLLAINARSTPQVDNWIVALTDLGGVYGVPVITAGLALMFWSRDQKTRALKLLVGVGGAIILSLVLKAIFSRSRPALWDRLVFEGSFSFPSGHAIASAAIAASLVAALWRTKYRNLSLVLGAGYVLLIGFTRLYLGVHYPTDILAGWVVAVSWVLLVQKIFTLEANK